MISIKRFKRLLRMITRRYKSLRSEVAKRPPSRGTNGRNSGGITGITFIIIHSGLFSRFFCDSRKASTTCRRFSASVLRCLELSLLALWRKSYERASRSRRSRSSKRHSAPILATNLLGSVSSRYWLSAGRDSSIARYSSSERKSRY